MLAPWKKSYDKPRQNIKKQKHYFANVLLVKAMVFPVVMYECESWTIKKNWWALKNWCLWTVVLKKALESPLDCKEIKPVNPNGNQSWVFIERTDAETEAPILWASDAKSWLFEIDPDIGSDWRQEEKGTAENEMVGWHHRLSVHEIEQALGDGDGLGSLACYSPWGCKVVQNEQLDNKFWKNVFLA